MIKVCEKCGADFEPRRFNAKVRRFCSRACANTSRDRAIWLDKNGYPQMTANGKSTPVHRHVMEKKLGRRLAPGETVHHRDGNRLNYEEANLELWTTRHGKGQRASDVFHLSVNERLLAAMSMGA